MSNQNELIAKYAAEIHRRENDLTAKVAAEMQRCENSLVVKGFRAHGIDIRIALADKSRYYVEKINSLPDTRIRVYWDGRAIFEIVREIIQTEEGGVLRCEIAQRLTIL